MLINANETILFQGDSITNAFRMPGEVNNAYQLGAGYAMIAAARLLHDRPADNLRIINRGVSGDRLAAVAARWEIDCLELRPTILSILIGINDALATDGRPATPVSLFEKQFNDLLVLTLSQMPSVQLILCEPFVLSAPQIGPEIVEMTRAYGRVVRSLAGRLNAIFVPLQSEFDRAMERAPAAYWSYDGIHPNAQGHWLIANAWLHAIASRGAA